MASYSSLKYDSSTPGWTVTYKIPWPNTSSQNASDTSYYTNISNYRGPTGASWYQQSWWENTNGHRQQLWAKIYHNTTGHNLVLSNMTFLTCAANSAGQSYRAAGGVLGYTSGYGVTFRARYYVSNSTDYTWSDDSYSVPDLTASSSLNKNGWLNNGKYGNIARYRNEYGKTSTSRNPHFGGCRSGYYVGDSEVMHYVKDRSYGPNVATLSFTDGAVIPDGEYAFLIIDITSWHGGSSSHQTIVCLGDDPYWTVDMEPEEEPYIWRMTDMGDGTRQWQKTHYAYQWTGTSWTKLDEKG